MTLAVSKSFRTCRFAPVCLAALSLCLPVALSAQANSVTQLRVASEPITQPRTLNAATYLHAAQASEAVLSPQTDRLTAGSRLLEAVTSAPKPQANTYSTTPVGTTNNTSFIFTFSFSSTTTITSAGVYTLGAGGSDFQDLGTGTCDTNGYPYTYAANSSCTQSVIFTPTKPGNRQGAAVLQTSTAGSYYSGIVNGIGSGPQVTFATASPAVSTIASGLTPYNSALDGAGDLWVTDSAAGAVKEFVLSNGAYPSSPTNTYTGFTSPQGIAIDGLGNVYVGDGAKGYVWRLAATNGVVPAGTTPLAYVTFLSAGTQPIFVAIDPTFTYLYFVGTYSSSKYLVYCTLSSGICSLVTTFTAPSGLAIDSAGYKYILDSSTKIVYRLAAAASSTTNTTVVSGLTLPYGIATDAAGDLYIADQGAGTSGAGTVTEYLATSGLVSTSSSSRTLASGFFAPSGVTVSSSGNVFIADTSNNALKSIDLTDPPGLAFADTTIGNVSPGTTVTLQNIGNASLNFPAPASGINPSVPKEFGLYNTGSCPIVFAGGTAGTLAYGATCTYVPAYDPQDSGAYAQFLIITDNNLNGTNATQSIKLAGSTGGLTIEVVAEIASKGSASVPLEVLVGYGGNTTPTVKPTVTVNGSSTGVGTVTCTAKLGHMNCTLNYNASSLSPGNYTISATVPANGPYSATSATGILSITGSSAQTASIRGAGTAR